MRMFTGKTSLAALILTQVLPVSAVLAQTQPGRSGATPPPASPPAAPTGSAAGPAVATPRPPQSFEEAYTVAGGSLNTMDEVPPAPGSPGQRTSSLFAVTPKQPKRVQKFDLITVIIREESDSKSASKSDLKKQYDFNAILQQYFKIRDFGLRGQPSLANAPQLQFQLDRNFKGDGTVDRSDSVSARVQAQVIDVKPNGILVIQATKMIKTDDEEQKFTLTGMVRAEDVTPDNSVLSTQLADLMLEKTTKGAATDTAKRGFVPEIIDKLNPF